jgi:hypothetical protein
MGLFFQENSFEVKTRKKSFIKKYYLYKKWIILIRTDDIYKINILKKIQNQKIF